MPHPKHVYRQVAILLAATAVCLAALALYLLPGPKRVVSLESGQFLSIDFDGFVAHRAWDRVWSADKGLVKSGFVAGGVKGSKALLITSSTTNDWSIKMRDSFIVVPGEVYVFQGMVRAEGGANGVLAVLLFDRTNHIVNWSYPSAPAGSVDWTPVKLQIKVPDGAQYMRFRLAGTGQGKVWFDNLYFEKISESMLDKR